MGQNVESSLVTLHGIAAFLEYLRPEECQLIAYQAHVRLVLENINTTGYGILEENAVLFGTIDTDMRL